MRKIPPNIHIMTMICINILGIALELLKVEQKQLFKCLFRCLSILIMNVNFITIFKFQILSYTKKKKKRELNYYKTKTQK